MKRVNKLNSGRIFRSWGSIFSVGMLLFVMGSLKSQTIDSLILNKPGWVLSGNYSATGLQSNPRSSSNFSYNDSLLGGSYNSNFSAEYALDLTPLVSVSEGVLEISFNYSFRKNFDSLLIEFWNADLARYVFLSPENGLSFTTFSPQSNYCSGARSKTYKLWLSNFSSNSLSNFKLRIRYTDGNNQAYGFCIKDLRIKSSTCVVAPSVNLLASKAREADFRLGLSSGLDNFIYKDSIKYELRVDTSSSFSNPRVTNSTSYLNNDSRGSRLYHADTSSLNKSYKPTSGTGTAATGTKYGWATSSEFQSINTFLQYFGMNSLEIANFKNLKDKIEIDFYLRDRRSAVSSQHGHTGYYSLTSLNKTNVFDKFSASISYNFVVTYKSSGDSIKIEESHAGPNNYGSVYGIVVRSLFAVSDLKASGLTQGTAYYYSARLKQCVGTSSGPWSASRTFTTKCVIAPLPYTQDFDSVITVNAGNKKAFVVPKCNEVDLFRGEFRINYGSSNLSRHPYSGSRYATVRYSSDVLFKTPLIKFQADSLYKFDMKYTSDGSSGFSYTVGVYKYKHRDSILVDKGLVTLIDSVVVGARSLNGASDVNPYLGVRKYFNVSDSGNYYVVLRVKGNNDPFYFTFDDINIDVERSTCFAPSNIVSTGTSLNSASISYTSNSRSSTGSTTYQIDIAAPGVAAGLGSLSVVSDTFATLRGLNAGTNYRIYVRAICGVGDTSDWSLVPINFNTTCPLSYTLPYNYGFETSACWVKDANAKYKSFAQGRGETPTSDTGPSGASQGSKYVFTEATGAKSTDTFLIYSPQINLDTVANKEGIDIQFDYHMYGANTGRLLLQLERPINSGNYVTLVEFVGQQQSSSTAAWKTAQYILPQDSLVDNLLKFRFLGTGRTSFRSDMSVDNFRVKYVSCNYNMPYNYGFETNSICWSNDGNAKYKAFTYQSGGTPSRNTGPSGASQGSKYVFTEASGVATTDTFLIYSPNIRLDTVANKNGADIQFDYHMYGADMGSLLLQLERPINSGNYVTLVKLVGQQQASSVAAWKTARYILSQDSLVDTLLKFRFLGTGRTSYFSDMAVDNFRVKYAVSSCNSNPSGFVTSEITETSAKVKWVEGFSSNISSYKVIYSRDTSVYGIEGTLYTAYDSLTINGLIPGNLYKVYLTPICGTDTSKVYSYLGNISTLCSSLGVLPYNYDFETNSACWSNDANAKYKAFTYRSGKAPNSDFTGPSGASQGSKYVFTESSGVATDTFLIYSPQIKLDTNANKNGVDIQFDYHMYGASTGKMLLQLERPINSGKYVTLVEFVGQQQTSSAAAWKTARYILSQDSLVDTLLKFRFLGTGATSLEGDMAVDNFRVKYFIGCNYNMPYNYGFETNSICWSNDGNAKYKAFTYQSGGTPSRNTGPSGASQGSKYVFTEASGVATTDTFLIYSPNIRLDTVANKNGADIQFDYHMYGADMGSLLLQLERPINSGNYVTLVKLVGQQQASSVAAWKTARYILSQDSLVDTLLKFRFLGTGRTSYFSDMAVDNFRVKYAVSSCNSNPSGFVTSEITETSAKVKWVEGFSSNISSYKVIYSRDTSVYGIEGTLYTAYDSLTINGLIPGNLYKVYLTPICGTDTSKVYSYLGNISTLCSSLGVLPYNYDFETNSACWSNDANAKYKAFTYRSGKAPNSDFTGPSGASQGSKYVFTESSGVATDTFLIYSPQIKLDTNANKNGVDIQFDYHMYGASTGKMLLQLERPINSGKYVTLVEFVGQQQTSSAAAWKTARYILSQDSLVDTLLKFRFLGTGATSLEGDMAVDNFRAKYVKCTFSTEIRLSRSDSTLDSRDDKDAFNLYTTNPNSYRHVWSNSTIRDSVFSITSQMIKAAGGNIRNEITVEVTDLNGCKSRDTAYVYYKDKGIVNLGEVLLNLEVYPNPSKGIFSIEMNIEEGIEYVSYKVLDLTGRLVKSYAKEQGGKVIKKEIDISDKSEGVYILMIETERGVIVNRLSLIK